MVRIFHAESVQSPPFGVIVTVPSIARFVLIRAQVVVAALIVARFVSELV